MKDILTLLLVLAVFLVGSLPPPACAAGSEYELKAAFLYYFVKFVEWPATAFADSTTPLVLGVIGQDPFGGAFDALDGKTVKNRTLKIKRLAATETQCGCQVLFISPSESGRAAEIARALAAAPILTIGDNLQNIGQQGVMVNFLLVENKIRLEVNTRATSRAKITISAQVLQMAKVVGEGS
ncbi:MAG: YfiR family protein [Deltaproteobacteria bacterium]|nr:YfiR family protein [Deltaproteobacteria bacterium]